MAECGYCGKELPGYEWGDRGHNPRLYCCLSHKQLAYIDRLTPLDAAAQRLRKATARKRGHPMEQDPDPVLPALVIEAYGTVTPPPDHTPDEGEKEQS